MLKYAATSNNVSFDMIAEYYNSKLAIYGDCIHEYDDSELRNAYMALARRECSSRDVITQDPVLCREQSREEDRLFREMLASHSAYMKANPGLRQKKEGFCVASLRYPAFCSLSFTEQIRKGLAEQIDAITHIGEKISHERLMKCYKHILLTPGAYSQLTGSLDSTFVETDYSENVRYTYFHTMLAMPAEYFMYRDLPILLFLWVKVRSKSHPGQVIRTYLDYPDGDLVFTVCEKAPAHFPTDFKNLPPFVKSALNAYTPQVSGGTNERKCIKEFFCDPTAWEKWFIPCCEHIALCDRDMEKE